MANGGIMGGLQQQGVFGQPPSSSGGSTQPAAQPAPQMNWQTGQAVAQPAPQPANPTGWNRPTFSADPNSMSATQNYWTKTLPGASAALNLNMRNQAALPEDQRASYKPLDAQGALDQTLRSQIQAGMGNYGNMVNYANQAGISQADIQRAAGAGNDVYTYMNRPNYQQYSPNGQFNPTIYQSNYQNYNTGNPMGVSQYGQGTSNPYGIGLDLASTPFNPYTNGYQSTPFTAPQAQTYYPTVPQTNYGPSRAIVSRSAGMRGTPNVVARKAEGGIASLMDDVG